MIEKNKETLKYNKKRKKKKLWKNIKKYKFNYFLCMPGLLILLTFIYAPLYFWQTAFKDYDVFQNLSESEWVGFATFTRLFDTKYFGQAVSNTVILFFMKIIFGFPAPIIFALFMNEIYNKYFKRTIQTVMYFPHFLSWVIVGSIFNNILSPSSGIINIAIQALGGESIYFMAERSWFRWVLTFTDVWKTSGWNTIIYLAAISGIPQDMYEAAYMDGAGRFQRIWYITFPAILPTVGIILVMRFAGVLNLFDQVFIMYNPLVAEVSETLDTYIYQISINNGRLSLGIAAGIFKSVIAAILVLFTNNIAGRIRGQELL